MDLSIKRGYLLGMVLALPLFVLGELLWLPDPLRLRNSFFWIDALDDAVYVLALIPLIWSVTAIRSMACILRQGKGTPQTRRELEEGYANRTGGGRSNGSLGPESVWALLRCGAVTVAGICAVLAVIFVPKHLVLSLGSLAAVVLLVFIDLIFTERSLRRLPIKSLSLCIGAIILLLVLFYPTAYLVTYPGITMNMNRYAQAEGTKQHGEIEGVLVFERPAFPVDWLYARLFPHYAFEPRENLGMSLGEYNQESHSMKEDADAAGSAIAFQRLGLGKGITPQGVRITGVLKGGPADGVLAPGDVIVGAAGVKVTADNDLAVVMGQVIPGQPVTLTIIRDGREVTVTAPTGKGQDDPKRAVFGIQIITDMQYDIPMLVSFHDYFLHEGGPSHGAMLALTLIDQLTPCGVTYGNRVAGTGTIEPGGLIGAIGGAEQKAFTVDRTVVDVFFVPADNEAEARRGSAGLNIVPVRTLDDVLAWLKAHPKPGFPSGGCQ